MPKGRGPLGMKVFRWKPVGLSWHYTVKELQALRCALMDDPANRNPEHLYGNSIYIYSEKARRKLDAVGWALYYHECKRKEAAQTAAKEAGEDWWLL